MVGSPVTLTNGVWASVGRRAPRGNHGTTVVPVVGVVLGVAPVALGTA